jgi:2-polyprenyl-6-methoxyphenol hydroxylase-like FAD-dependent oxidoreductase
MTSTQSPNGETVHDVVVVGARCAGAATAMLLARQGHDVVMVDRAEFPSDTLSTHAIARGGVVQLHRWGLLDRVVASGAPPIRRVLFDIAGTEIVKTIKDAAGVDHLLAPRRYVLDTILAGAAVEAGASFRSGVSVTGTLTDSTGRVTGVEVRDADGVMRRIHGRVVVGADGLRSRIARSVGAEVIDARPSEAAALYSYVAGIDPEGFEFHVGDRAFTGLFTTHDDEANVWMCLPAEAAQLPVGDRTEAFLDLLEQTTPRLAERVRRGRITAPVRSAIRFPNQVRRAAGPGWALVGDAAYHRDPITGHGITDAFRDAELLARHLGDALRDEVPEAEALRAYDEQRYEALLPIFDLTVRLAQYPPFEEFSELQMQLSTLIEAEARWLAELPHLPAGDLVAA